MKWNENYFPKEKFTCYKAKKNKHYIQIDKEDDNNSFALCVTAPTGHAVFKEFDTLETAKQKGEEYAINGVTETKIDKSKLN